MARPIDAEPRERIRRLERWLDTRERGAPLAVVLGAAWNGLSFARSLGRRGVDVLVLDSQRYLGVYTRHAQVVMLPPPEDEPHRWLEITSLVAERTTEPSVLLPMGDAQTLLVSRFARRLDPHFRFVVPAQATVERILDKRRQYAVAEGAGIPIPEVHFPATTDEVRALVPRVRFPCLLKPPTSHLARATVGGKVIVCPGPTELVAAFERLAAHGITGMVQELVPGGDSALYGYLAFWDESGREVAWLTKRKLRQSPPGIGDGSLQVTIEAPEVAGLSRRLLHAFDFRGFVGVEFKRDAETGELRLIEINPRTVSGNELAIAAGVDFPWIAYRHLTGSSYDPPSGFRHGVTYVNEELDVQAFATLRRAGELTAGQWLRSIRGAEARAVWARDDPMPMLAGLGRARRLLTPRPSVIGEDDRRGRAHAGATPA